MNLITYFLISVAILLSDTNFIFSQNYWTRLNGPYGGNAIDLKKHFNGNLYTLRNEGLYVSSDSGESWTKVNEMLSNTNLCMDISSSGIIYVGKSSGGLWWSANSGQSWSFNPIHIAPHSGSWASVIVVKVNSLGHIYINNYVSFNGGQTFNTFLVGNSSVLSYDYAFDISNHVYTATNNGVYYSVNNGSTWTYINGNLPTFITTSLMFDNNLLIVGLKGGGVYKTSNNGTTWEAINNGLSDLSINKVYKDAFNNYYAGSTMGKVFKSSNGGISWTEIFSSSSDNIINSIYTDQTSIYNLTSSLGIVKSTDNGITWTEKNFNLSLPGINSLAFSDNNEIYAASNSGILYSSSNGLSWERKGASLPTTFINSIYRDVNGILLAGLRNYGIYRSMDNGNTWQSSNKGILSQGIFKYIKHSSNGFLYTVSVPTTFFLDTLRLYRSSDNGNSWTKILSHAAALHHFTIDASGVLYLAGLGSTFQSTILKSTDNGNNWSENVLTNFFIIDNFTSSANNLYLTFLNNVYRSTDMGATWNEINNGGWQSTSISSIAVNSIGNILLSISNEFYVTTNNGSSWVLQNSGLTQDAMINNLIFDNHGYVFGTTYFYGIFKSIQSTITSASVNLNLVSNNFKLEQNYPNPFNPVTVISYQLAVSNFVTIKVYNVRGNEVVTLVNEKQNAGAYSINWDATNFPSGIYYYKLSAESFINTKKMVLLK